MFSLQFVYGANRSTNETANLALYHILQHLEHPNNYAHLLFVDFSPVFSTALTAVF